MKNRKSIHYLKNISKNFPEHYDKIAELSTSLNVYTETSAINYLIKELDQNIILNTRDYLQSVNKKWLTSPLALWELMLIFDDLDAEKTFYLIQNLFHSSLLASPSELVARYLLHAYPKNRVNYSFLSSLDMVNTWQSMTNDSRRTFVYDKDALKKKTSLYRQVSKNLDTIINGRQSENELVNTISYTTNTIFECLERDGWHLPKSDLHTKFVIIYVILLLVLCGDIDGKEVNEFWKNKNLANAPTHIWIQYIFEHYPKIFFRGPIAEMANMACYQYKINRKDRGIILDGMHMVYAPYVDMILSNDEAFKTFRDKNPFYLGRLFHMSEIQLHIVDTHTK